MPSSFSALRLPPVRPKGRSSPPRSYSAAVGGRTGTQGETTSPDILLRPFRGRRLRSDRRRRPAIAKRMEVPSWGREQHTFGLLLQKYGTGEMTSRFARLPFFLSPRLDERVCPFKEHLTVLPGVSTFSTSFVLIPWNRVR